MGYADQDFWGALKAAAPGMLSAGMNWYANRGLRQEGQNELNTAQGPDYQAPMAASRTALANAGSLDPKAAGADWLGQQRQLLAPGDSADEAGLMRMLNASGMLGAASYGVQGPGAAPNVAQNPLAATYYAQRNNRDARMAAEATDRGQGMIDTQLKRSAELQNQAQQNRSSTVNTRAGTVGSPATNTAQLMKGLGDIFKNTGMLDQGVDWMKRIFGGGGGMDFGTGMTNASADMLNW